MADAEDLKSFVERRVGSNPAGATKDKREKINEYKEYDEQRIGAQTK